ncbi:MAG: hypothetical protein ABI583_02105 [Betaproteobacteria bacterium]
MHTWFFPPHHGIGHLSSLSEMVFDGLGEVELHYHHQDDTEKSLRHDLVNTINSYRRWGFLLESGETPRPAFGFIHGDWALGNSCRGKFCGVNNELAILKDLGCWGDFTMPSGNVCQTRKINSIYYATGDPRRPKSHNWGKNAQVGKSDQDGLFLMQGPLGINWHAPDHPRIENASLTTRNWGRPDRITKWLDCDIHVEGKPEWLFVKLHAHGAMERDFDALFGEKAFEMHRVLNEQFNDGKLFRIHYVTARQAYNIAKAAEHGQVGCPSNWIDYVVGPQPHTYYSLDAVHDLVCCTKDRLAIKGIENTLTTKLRTRVGPIIQVVGAIHAVNLNDEISCLYLQLSVLESDVSLHVTDDFEFIDSTGGKVLKTMNYNGVHELRIRVGQECTITYRNKSR